MYLHCLGNANSVDKNVTCVILGEKTHAYTLSAYNCYMSRDMHVHESHRICLEHVQVIFDPKNVIRNFNVCLFFYIVTLFLMPPNVLFLRQKSILIMSKKSHVSSIIIIL